MSVIWPGLEAEVERRRELLLAARRPPITLSSGPRHDLRRRVGWAFVRLGLAVARQT